MSYTDQELKAVWNKATIVSGYDSDKLRQDACTAWIEFSEYGNRDSDHGWEVDHIVPNGSDTLSNWQPLHWKNNVSKSDGKLVCNTWAKKS